MPYELYQFLKERAEQITAHCRIDLNARASLSPEEALIELVLMWRDEVDPEKAFPHPYVRKA